MGATLGASIAAVSRYCTLTPAHDLEAATLSCVCQDNRQPPATSADAGIHTAVRCHLAAPTCGLLA